MKRSNRSKITKRAIVSIILLLLLGTMTMVAGATGDPPDPGVITVNEATDILGIDIQPDSANLDRWTRSVGIAVAHLVNEQEITDQQRVLH